MIGRTNSLKSPRFIGQMFDVRCSCLCTRPFFFPVVTVGLFSSSIPCNFAMQA